MPLRPRRPSVLPWNQAPLSLVNITRVRSRRPRSSSAPQHLADAPVEFLDGVAVGARRGLAAEALRREQRHVHVLVREVEEERLVAIASMKPIAARVKSAVIGSCASPTLGVSSWSLRHIATGNSSFECGMPSKKSKPWRNGRKRASCEKSPRCHLPTMPVA